MPVAELAEALGLEPPPPQAVLADIETKRRTTAPLHAAPVLVEPVLPHDAR